MPKVFGVRYSDKPSEILAHREIGKAYKEFAKKKRLGRQAHFLKESIKRPNPKKHYRIYFASNARYRMGFNSSITRMADELGQAQDWTAREWSRIYRYAEIGLNDRLKRKLNKEFFTERNLGTIPTIERKAKRSLKQKMTNKMWKESGLESSEAATEVAYHLQCGNKTEAFKAMKSAAKNQATKAVRSMFNDFKSTFRW